MPLDRLVGNVHPERRTRGFFIKTIIVEVILKKTKITNSILKQALRSTETDFKVGQILGWCICDKMKYIVCYRDDTKSLSRYPMFKSLTTHERYRDSYKYVLKVSLGANYTPLVYESKTREEIEKFVDLLEIIKLNAESKGQFFI